MYAIDGNGLKNTQHKSVSEASGDCAIPLRRTRVQERTRRCKLGDKGGKKDKEKMAKQKEKKSGDKDRKKREKQGKGID